MSIVKMKRFKVIALARDQEKLLAQLMRLGCVEISEPEDKLADPDWTALLSRDTSELGQVKAQSADLDSALKALKKYAPVKTGLFQTRDTISESALFDPGMTASALKNAEEINASVAAISQLYTQENRLTAQRASLLPWSSLDLPLESGSTEHVEILMGTVPASASLDDLRGELAQAAPLAEIIPVSADREQQYILLFCHKSQWAEAQGALKPYTFTVTRFKDLTGTAAENVAALGEELAEIAVQREKEVENIRAHAGCRHDLQVVSDRLAQDAAREAAREQAMTDGTIVFLEGWAAVPKLDKVEKVLQSFDAAYSFRDPMEGDDVPTLLDNPGWMQPINMVTEMYSAPAYDGIDPNPLIFGWYVFFFGFMFADVAYGLIIWAACMIITRKYHPKGGMGQAFGLGKWLGASTAICGIFTGGFFGNSITVVAETFLNIPSDQLPGWLQAFCNGLVVNPVTDPMTVLILSVAIGFLQLVTGQCIHIYMEARDGDLIGGLMDVVPWWIFFAGLACLLLLNTPVVVILGVIALIATQGRNAKGFFGKLFGGISSLYDVTSWLSDVLSYARLMALMLATSVIAMVFNTLAALPKIFAIFLLIFVIGHAFNIGINLIGTYVHAARLQYLEFYGKFYKDGGRFFKPLKYNTKFVDINEEEN